MEQVRLQSRNGWSASDPFGGLKVWGRGERGGTVFFENGFCLLLLFNGGRRKMNSVVQNDTVLAFLFFFFLYETTSFWIKRAVSFK
jgi:hypothetical protein